MSLPHRNPEESHVYPGYSCWHSVAHAQHSLHQSQLVFPSGLDQASSCLGPLAFTLLQNTVISSFHLLPNPFILLSHLSPKIISSAKPELLFMFLSLPAPQGWLPSSTKESPGHSGDSPPDGSAAQCEDQANAAAALLWLCGAGDHSSGLHHVLKCLETNTVALRVRRRKPRLTRQA